MPRIADFLFRLRTLLTLRTAERELNDEFAFHLEMARDKLIAEGWSPDAADAEGRRRFGGMTRERQRVRDQWGIGVLRDLASDVRHALRQYRRQPAFSILGTVTLALGIGATVSLFSVVRGTLLRPLPIPHEERVHVFWDDYDWRGVEVDHIKSVPRAFEGIAAYTEDGHTLQTADGNTTGLGALVTADFFTVLGRAPLRGRVFQPGDDRPGAAPGVVISWGLWQRQFGGATDAVGKTLILDGVPTTVIGVMPRDFYFPTPNMELWRTLRMDPADDGYNNNGQLVVFGRAKPGATPAALTADLHAIATALGQRFTYPVVWDKTKNAHTVPLREYLMGDVRPALLLLLGAVVALLLMACANVAALVLSRTTDRRPELVLRTALGAARGRLVRQIVAESLVLATIAGVVGSALAASTFRLLVASLPFRDGLGGTLSIDWAMFATAFGLALVVTLLVAIAPARSLLTGELRGIDGERSAVGLRGGNRRFYGMLVSAEICLGVLLASGSLLLVRSVARLYARDPGFAASGVVTLDLVTAATEMSTAARIQFFSDAAAAAARTPGVQMAGIINRIPVRDGGGQGSIVVESRPDLSGAKRPNSANRQVSPGYFSAMGIAIVHGRAFTDDDRAGTLPVAIVTESFASRMWPGQDPLGQRVSAGWGAARWVTVVGVAKEARLFSMTGENPIGLYLPIAQLNSAPVAMVVVAKTSGVPANMITTLRGVMHGVDRRVAVGRVSSMEDVVSAALADRLQLRFFLTLFATLALVLGAIGVYGVVSYAVSRRRAEFGVRMALGATGGTVFGEVIRRGLVPVGFGVALGIGASLAMSRTVSKFLFDVQPTDAISLGGAATAFLVAGVLAVVVPGWRASKTNPVEVLRGE